MQTINGAELRRMILSAAASIEIHKQDLNELNVFPVPDGDTGTNMSMTIHAAANDLRSMEGADLYAVAKTAASATLRGARGNSGVILSLLFKGLKRGMKGHETCDGILWAQALQEGVDAAYKAVMKPAEGTILTVSRLAAAKAAAAAQEKNDVEYVQAAALEEAKIALADTVNQNPVLKKDLAMPPMLTNGPLYYTDTYADGDTVTLAGISVRVMETPGHTPGSVCLIAGDTMFSGDTLFAGSCGRTDLPCGDAREMRDSLRKLAKLEENYRVCPGHGPSSTLDREKKTNPYL